MLATTSNKSFYRRGAHLSVGSRQPQPLLRPSHSRAHSDQDHVCCFDGNIRASPDSNAHISLGQGWGVVHPVSHHGDFLPFVLKLLDLGHLVRRQYLGKDFVDANLKGKRSMPKVGVTLMKAEIQGSSWVSTELCMLSWFGRVCKGERTTLRNSH